MFQAIAFGPARRFLQLEAHRGAGTGVSPPVSIAESVLAGPSPQGAKTWPTERSLGWVGPDSVSTSLALLIRLFRPIAILSWPNRIRMVLPGPPSRIPSPPLVASGACVSSVVSELNQ